jgi:hypothetical protein
MAKMIKIENQLEKFGNFMQADVLLTVPTYLRVRAKNIVYV